MHVACIGNLYEKDQYEKEKFLIQGGPRTPLWGARVMKKKKLITYLMLLVYGANVTLVCFVYEIFVNKI